MTLLTALKLCHEKSRPVRPACWADPGGHAPRWVAWQRALKSFWTFEGRPGAEPRDAGPLRLGTAGEVFGAWEEYKAEGNPK
jgi:hypothetical protein